MFQLQVSIGRNIGAEPMSADLWRSFQDDARANLYAHTTGDERTVEFHYGTGVWDGVAEESAHVTIHTVRDYDRAGLTRALAVLAHVYGQDAIALSIGVTDLIEAAPAA